MKKRLALSVVLALASTAAAAHAGYLTTSRGTIVTSASGDCVHTRSWSPKLAFRQCDPVPVAVVAPPPPVVAAVPPPAQPKVRHFALSTDVLFPFDSARLLPGAEPELDELAGELKGERIQRFSAVGHADRIGSEVYNMGLSLRRASTVSEYLGAQGLDPARIDVAGRGESDPLTHGQCDGLTGEALIGCLQPNRRVEIEVRTLAGGG